MKRIKDIGEEGIIRIISDSTYKENEFLKIGIGDDCAVINIPETHDVLITTDMLVEGTHFLIPNFKPEGIGTKAILSNISDIASMGGIPLFATLSIGLPPDLPLEFLTELVEGMNRVCKSYKVSIIGGDTVRSEKVLISVTLIGITIKDRIARRDGAKPDELVFTTGNLGASAIGLEAIVEGYDPKLFAPFIKSHYEPDVKVDFAHLITKEGLVSSMIDISDGLTKDAERIANLSKVAMVIVEDSLPLPKLDEEQKRYLKKRPIEYVLSGGEDYELLFTAPKEHTERIVEIAKDLKIKLSIIGFTEEGRGLYIERGGKRYPIRFEGFEHF